MKCLNVKNLIADLLVIAEAMIGFTLPDDKKANRPSGGEIAACSGNSEPAVTAKSHAIGQTGSNVPLESVTTTRDNAMPTVINTWLADPAFASVKPHLAAIRSRLANFANPAELAR